MSSGEDFPTDASEHDLEVHLQDAKALLHNVIDKELLNYKAMTDRTMIMAMKLLWRGCTHQCT
ncbi:hypothetical protein ACHAWF_015696 [Thalassiosira exigua]